MKKKNRLITVLSGILILTVNNSMSSSAQANESNTPESETIHNVSEEKADESFYEPIDISTFNTPLSHLQFDTQTMAKTMSTSSTNIVTNTTVDRVDGQNRMRVAENISKKGWSTSDTVFIANGYKFTDALSGTPLAAYHNAPMLLVNGTRIYSETLTEIARLKARNVIILGGPRPVPEHISNTLKNRGLNVRRIAGQNRYDTSRMIAEELISLRGPSTAHLVNGDAYADAVSISAVAGRYQQPILLTRANELHPEVNRITSTVQDWRIIGGPDSVSATTEAQLRNRVTNVSRLTGRDRYEVNKRVLSHWGLRNNKVYVGSGTAFADVLTASVIASREGSGVLLLSNRDRDIDSAITYSKDNKLDHFVVLGGTVTIPTSTANVLKNIVINRVHSNGVYTVERGDTFRSVATSFGHTSFQLSQWNTHIKDINNIAIGTKLAVTRKGVESMLPSAQKSNLIKTDNKSQFNNVQDFIQWISPLAVKVSTEAKQEALYPSLMIAQAIHESGVARAIGESQLARPPYHNLFGIKARGDQAYVLTWTWEHMNNENISVLAGFRRFPSYEQSLQAYAQLLRFGRGTGEDFYYRGTWQSNTKDVWEVLDKGGLRGYATDPAYFTAIRRIINEHNLTQFDK